jgi:CHASE1-domain containing sensor protein
MTPAKKDRMPSPAWLLVIAAVGLAAILTILAFLQIRASRNSQIHADFTRKAQIMAATLQGSLSSYFDVLYAVKGLYDSSEKVERREFHIFVQRLLKRHAGIQALEWIPRVTRAQRPTFEASARDDGIYEFQITERQSQGTMVPAAKRSVYYPVYYVEPYIGNELALGFDLASNAERMAAIKRARESGKLTATARLTLVQEPHKQYGIIAFLPVYNRKGDPDPATGDRISLEGFVLGVFRIGEMVTAALDAFEQETIMYSLYDRTASPENQLLWRHNPQKKNKPDTTAGRPPEIKFADWWFSSEFDMGGRSWTIRFAPTTRYFARYDFWAAWAVLAGGLLFAGMIGCLLFALLKRSADLAATNSNIQTEMAERILAEKKVRASERRYRRLISNLDTGVVVHGSDTRILLANHRAQDRFHPVSVEFQTLRTRWW